MNHFELQSVNACASPSVKHTNGLEELQWINMSHILSRAAVALVATVVVVSLPHQSPRCGASRFRLAQSIAIPLSVWSVSLSPAL